MIMITMAKLEEKIKNSIYAYVLGDALGVPFEFRKNGTFKCHGFVGNGTHDQPKGTWSDDTSILLCILESLTRGEDLNDCIGIYKENLGEMLYHGKFTIDGRMFDIGYQTKMAIMENFPTRISQRCGNGCLFYSLPLAIYLIEVDDIDERRDYIEKYCRITHNNETCIKYCFKLSEQCRAIMLDHGEVLVNNGYENNGDVINTYNLVISEYDKLSRINGPLFQKLCRVVNLGNDTDTNTALVGGLLGIQQGGLKGHLKQVRGFSIVEEIVKAFILKNNTLV